MTYQADGDRITLEMTRDDYGTLLLALGYATGSIPKDEKARFWRWIDFVNRLNTGNPDYTPYEIPEEFRP